MKSASLRFLVLRLVLLQSLFSFSFYPPSFSTNNTRYFYFSRHSDRQSFLHHPALPTTFATVRPSQKRDVSSIWSFPSNSPGIIPPTTAIRPEKYKTNECIKKERREVKSDDDTEQSIYLPAHLLLVFPSDNYVEVIAGRQSRGKLCVVDKDLCDVLLVAWRLPLSACTAS